MESRDARRQRIMTDLWNLQSQYSILCLEITDTTETSAAMSDHDRQSEDQSFILMTSTSCFVTYHKAFRFSTV